MFGFGMKQYEERRGFGVVDLLVGNLSVLLVVKKLLMVQLRSNRPDHSIPLNLE